MEKRNTAGGSAARENPAGERLPESETALKDPTEDRVFCRALLAVTAGALLFAWAVTALHLEPVFFTPCLFHRITGLYCPGCGGTRALIALLRGHPLRSLRLHPLVLPGILWAAAYLGSHLLAASGVRKMPVLRISRRPLIAGIVILAGNFVIKNLCLAAFGIDLLSR